MGDLQLIVDKLSDAPFNKKFRLVDLDELNPLELVGLLQEVFVAMDPAQDIDIREEDPSARSARMVGFLRLMKFQFPSGDQREAFRMGLVHGDKNVIYPVLHWCLARLPALTKRAYLARFLVPVEVPAEYMGDEIMGEIHTSYKELQNEFKATHKEVDALRQQTNFKPEDMRDEITQLEVEKKQLSEKISKNKRNAQDIRGFDQLLEATSKLRSEQEEESRLMDRMHEQRIQLEHAQNRHSELQRKLTNLRASASHTNSAERLLDQLNADVNETQRRIDRLPGEFEERRDRLAKLDARRAEPRRSRDEVAEIAGVVQELTHDNEMLRGMVEKAQAESGDGNLALLRPQVKAMTNRMLAKEEEVEDLREQRRGVLAEIEEKERKLSAQASGGGGGGAKTMTAKEFKKYGAQLREKTHQYKRMKQELAELQSESVVLNRTEQVLRGRDSNLQDFLDKLEAKRGVAGYTATQDKLTSASEQTAEVDAAKGKTLEEISKIVRDITQKLKEKKNKLAPQIKELRAVRQRYQETEVEYMRKKNVYEKTGCGLDVEVNRLEQECNAFQEECLREESRYHYLNCLHSIAQANLERVEQEDKWESGEGRLLPDFQCYKDLYKNKLGQQENLSKQLRREQKRIKENETGNMGQRKMFVDLKRLMDCKLRLKRQDAGAGGFGGVNIGSNFESMDIGGANVMVI